MNSASRDAMMARVNEAFKKWPAFFAMPETKEAGRRVAVSGDPDEQANYVKALYACCYDSVPLGRDGVAIVGKLADDDNEAAQWATVKRTQAIVKEGLPLIDDLPGKRLKTW